MKKHIILIILIGFATVVFPGGAKEAAAGPVTITYWQYFFQSKVETIDLLIQKFEAENPGIKVQHVTFPYETYNQKVASSVPVGTGPDVLNLFYGWQPLYVKSGYLQELSQKDFSPDFFKQNFFPFVEQSVKFNNKYYSVPNAVRTLALFWNKKLFWEAGLDPETPPKTLDELAAFAKRLTRYDAQGNIIQAGLAMQPTGQGHNWLREVLIRQFGGIPYSEDGRKVAYNTPEGAAALHQKAAMNIDGSFRIAAFKAIPDLEWAVAELPTHRGVKSNYASFWTHGIAAGVRDAKLDAAGKFLKFITSAEAQGLWLEKVG